MTSLQARLEPQALPGRAQRLHPRPVDLRASDRGPSGAGPGRRKPALSSLLALVAAIRPIERLPQHEAARRRSRWTQYQLRSATEEASRL